MSIDNALATTLALLRIFDNCHQKSIYHRDVKPDNILLRLSNPSDPIVVDFGMAWLLPDEDENAEFITPAGQELGNRFLRLPEYAPKRHVHDARSDLTMLMGVFFFLLTGQAPRVLTDAFGKKPHEAVAENLPEVLRNDRRWPKINRIFNVAFQDYLDLRFQSAEQLRNALTQLEAQEDAVDELSAELLQLQEIWESHQHRFMTMISTNIRTAANTFRDVLEIRTKQVGLEVGGGITIEDAGRQASMYFPITGRNVFQPRADFNQTIRFEDNMIVVAYSIEWGEYIEYYRGPAVDAESLMDAVKQEASRVLAQLVRIYSKKLKDALDSR